MAVCATFLGGRWKSTLVPRKASCISVEPCSSFGCQSSETPPFPPLQASGVASGIYQHGSTPLILQPGHSHKSLSKLHELLPERPPTRLHVRALRALPNVATPAPSTSFLLNKRCLLTLALTRWSCHTSRTHGAWLRGLRSFAALPICPICLWLLCLHLVPYARLQLSVAWLAFVVWCGMFPGTCGGMSLSGPQLKFSQQTSANLESASNPLKT